MTTKFLGVMLGIEILRSGNVSTRSSILIMSSSTTTRSIDSCAMDLTAYTEVAWSIIAII